MSAEIPKGNPQSSKPPEGVPPKTWDFLLDVVRTGVYTTITPEQRNMIGIYYGSGASFVDLQKMFGYTSSSSIKYRILKGMDQLWGSLPAEMKTKHNPDITSSTKYSMPLSSRRKIATSRKNQWDNDPEYRAKLEKAAQERSDRYRAEHPPVPKEPKPSREKKPKKPTIPVGSPEDRARRSEIARRLWADPISGARMREAAKHRAPSETRAASMRVYFDDPDWMAEMGRIHRELWEDPEYREKTTQAIIQGKNTPEAKEKQSKAGKRTWRRPGFRAKMRKIHQEVYRRDDMGAKMKAGRDALLTDPQYRERIREIRSRIWNENNMTEKMNFLRENEYVKDKSNFAKDESVIELWIYASSMGLTEKMVAEGIINAEDIDMLSRFFTTHGKTKSPSDMLVDKFTAAVARLA